MPADKKQPADKDRDRDTGDLGDGDRHQAQDYHHDAFGDKQFPVRVNCRREPTPEVVEAAKFVELAHLPLTMLSSDCGNYPSGSPYECPIEFRTSE